MKEFWNAIQFIFTVLGGWIGYFLGGCDGLIIALICFVAVDYITGLMCAVSDRRLSSKAGFRGICRKVLIFTLVGVANIIDIQIIHTGRKQTNSSFVLYSLPKKESAARVGITLPKKIGNAVKRNLIKRQTRMMCQDLIDFKTFGRDVILIVRFGYLNRSYEDNKKNLEKLLVKSTMDKSI